MNYLQGLVDDTFKDILKPDEMLLRLIKRRFSEFGIVLSPSQITELKNQLQTDQLDKFTLELTDEQETQLKNAKFDPSNLVLDFSDFDIEGLEEKIGDIFENAIPTILESFSDLLLKTWKDQAPSLLKQQEEGRLKFSQSVSKIWSKPLRLLEILLSASMEAGAHFNKSFRPIAVQENDLIFEVLTRSHARACQVGFEILALLSNGFADGAFARWRTLHEIAVVAQFITQHGNALAECYLDHKMISDYKEALEYQRHCSTLGYMPISQSELDTLKAERDTAVRRYGSDFKSDYGWAVNVLGKKRPNFVDIEKAVNLDHLRPFYKAANLNVHAGSKSILFRFGSPLNDRELLLSGGSVFGLSEPGQNTALSINQITITLLLTKPNLDRMAFATTTNKLVNEVFWAFDEVMASLENEGGS